MTDWLFGLGPLRRWQRAYFLARVLNRRHPGLAALMRQCGDMLIKDNT